jgi:Mn-dependent DtxR family transcriptional regulator
MSAKDKLDQFHYHEMLDRLYVLMSTLDDHIIQHPVCKLEKEISTNVEQALSLLWQAYQDTGKLSDKKFESEK